MYLNKITVMGNLTKDPESKALPSGTTVTNFSVAVNRNYKDKDGNKKEEVEYINIVSFGKQAEVINQYVKKGHQIYVEGRLQTRSYDDKEGNKKYVTEVIMENFQFGNNKKEGDENKTVGYNNKMDKMEEDIDPEDSPF